MSLDDFHATMEDSTPTDGTQLGQGQAFQAGSTGNSYGPVNTPKPTSNPLTLGPGRPEASYGTGSGRPAAQQITPSAARQGPGRPGAPDILSNPLQPGATQGALEETLEDHLAYTGPRATWSYWQCLYGYAIFPPNPRKALKHWLCHAIDEPQA